MKLRTPLSALVGLTLATGCDDSGSSTSSTATVTGRYVAESGASSSGEAEIVQVDDDGQTGLIASGAVRADGTFTLEVPPDAGPFIVQIRQARADGSAAVSGQALLPYALEAGERVSADVTAESSAEASAYLAIVSGEADTVDVDGIGLMAWIDTKLAAEADAARLGAAWMQYQAGFIATANASGANLNAAAITELGAELHKEFAASAGDLESEITFQRELAAELATKVSYEAQVDARLAASALGAMALSSEGGGGASELAAEAGAELSAHAAWASQAAIAGADLEARLDTAYEAFFAALAQGEAMAGAQAELAAALGGDGQVAIGSALAIAASADGVSAAELRAAMNDASSRISAQLEAAFAGAGSARVDAVAEALIEARGAAREHFEGRLGINATARLASELFVMTSHTEHLLSIDLITATLGVTLQGTFDAALDTTGIVAIVATSLSGELIAEGTMNGSSQRGFSLEGLTSADVSGPIVIAANDAAGGWVGAMVVTGVSASGSGSITLAESMSAETTARARVAIELVARGESDAEAVALIELMSEAEAAIVETSEDAIALGAAMEARAAFMAAQDELGSSLDAELGAFAGSAFELAAAHTSSGSAWRFELLTRVEAALAIEATADSELGASRFDEVRAELTLAVEAFIEAASEVDAQAEAEAAWTAFVTQVDTTLDTTLRTALGVVADAQLAARLEAALEGAIEARSDFEASLDAAFSNASTELSAAASTVVSAAATWQSALSASLDLSFLVHLVAADQAAAAELMAAAHIWLGR